MKKPNIHFIGIGAPRCATSWVTQCLREHPKLFVPINKELNFFNKLPSLDNKTKLEFEGIQGYYVRFGNTQGLKAGEFSTGYFNSQEAIENIKKHFPNIKIILCLRNPVDRYFSSINYPKNYDKINLIKRDYINAVKYGFYFKYLKKWYKYFDKENVHIIIYEDIHSNPIRVIENLYKFLGVNPRFVPKSINKIINPQGIPKSSILHKTQYAIPKVTAIIRKYRCNWLVNILRFFGANKIYWLIWEKNLKPMEIKKNDLKLTERLKKIYNADIKNLEKLIKRDLSYWK